MAVLCLILFCCYAITAVAAYTLTPSESLVDGQTLVSQGGTFELGFFRPSNDSENRYLGIWYKTIPEKTVVWVANRDAPLNGTSGAVKILDGSLVILNNHTGSVVWSSNSSKQAGSPVVEFLVSGNLVLRDAGDMDTESYLWQSFDSPSQTLLPGMKLGWNLKTGRKWYMSSWKNWDDPSTGDYTFEVDLGGYFEPEIKKGSKKYYRAGPWNGVIYSGTPDLKPNAIFTVGFVQNAEEVYYMYRLVNQSVMFRLTLTQTDSEVYLQRFTWIDNAKSWVRLVSIPRDRCDDYGLCGIYSTCEVSYGTLCQCLEGFRPKDPQGWSLTDWSQGCVREAPVNCSHGEGFRKFTGMKLPDTAGSWVNRSTTLEECRVQCLKNCSCIAYATLNVQAGGSGCIMWSTDLIDMRQLSEGGQDLYVRMAAAELDYGVSSKTKRNVIMAVSITLVAVAIVLSLGSRYMWKKRNSKGVVERDDLELPLYDLISLATATNNFSQENKLGEGGFGPVYKGALVGGQEIAVKRLSKDSIQGVVELKNEVKLISELQHRNLVRLLGCCIQGEEKMLVYEYMPNQSLDSYIFDPIKSKLLDWEKRFNIILGIARGVLYLHHDSRLRIIHRDLKASNILLDNEMVPKIADFGMARIFLGDQTDAKTKRVVGTYGYMSPEYVLDGRFSVKSDVFSFGVLVLEVISGKRNRSFSHPDHEHNLLGHAWRLQNEGRSMELVDDAIRGSCLVEDVARCIHIGLLCVQKHTFERPTMSSVVLMLSSERSALPEPQHPGFYLERSTSMKENPSYNSTEATITVVEGR